MKHLVALLFLLFGYVSFAQSNSKALWRDYLPYAEVTQILKVDDIVYASTPYALFSYNLEDNSVERISKTNQLTDFGVTAMGYNAKNKTLIIGYLNGNIDFLTPSGTINFPAILSSSLIGDKTINHIYSEGDFIYVSTGFGIVKINVTKNEVLETYIIGNLGEQLNVNTVAVGDSKIYAATDLGLKTANKNSAFLSDFSQWTDDGAIPNAGTAFSNVIIFDNKPFVTYKTDPFIGDELYYFDGSWQNIPELSGLEIRAITHTSNEMLVTTAEKIFVFNKSLTIIKEITKHDSNYAIKDDNSTIWQAAAFFEGLIKIESGGTSEAVFPTSPIYRDVYHLSKVVEGNIWVTSGLIVADKGFAQFNDRGIQRFDGKSWSLYNSSTIPEMDVPNSTEYLYVSANPSRANHVVITNYLEGGMFEIKGDEVTHYTAANSSLSISSDGVNYNLGDAQFDNNGNIWIANSRTSKPLVVKTKDGEWASFNCGSGLSTARFSELLIDTRGYKWMISPNEFGAVVYNDNNTPTDVSDDEFKRLTGAVGLGGLPNTQIWSIAEDLNGQIWLGTEEGIAVVFNPSGIFSGGNYDASEILIEQDGNVEVLLGAERITALVVDGANRKWVGTASSGVYCFSPDGLEQIFHFTKENSPLFSNNIYDIQINNQLGEVLIATQEGLMGYKTAATLGAENFSGIYAYPNPVRSTYSGDIFINGLLRDSDVKITDIEGNLVFETTSLGGQAVWNGTDKFGNRVTTGVYLVFVAAPDGSLAEVTKLLFVR